MAQDRFVYWGKTKKPTNKQVEIVCTCYFGSGASDIQVSPKEKRITITLFGEISHPLRLIKGAMPWPPSEYITRYIEVYIDTKYVDIITRQQDEYTNALAEGLADIFARFWEGRRDE